MLEHRTSQQQANLPLWTLYGHLLFKPSFGLTVFQLRNVIGAPVPHVYAWSSLGENSAVGAEYIIMEKVSGVQLENAWPSMKSSDKLDVLMQIARYHKSLTSISFSGYGSLYYAKDLEAPLDTPYLYVDEDGNQIKDARFAIGPSTGRNWFDYGKAAACFDKGPCKSFHYVR